MPAGSGRLNVYEPRFLAMFDALQAQQLQDPGSKMRFAHICRPSDWPSGMREHTNESGLPKCGSVATVTALERNDDGTMRVSYELSGRFQVLNVLGDDPVTTVLASDYEDDGASLAPMERQRLDDLEQEVLRTLRELEKLSSQLSEGGLPPAIRRYAPPPAESSLGTFTKSLSRANVAAGGDIATYMAQPSVYGTVRQGKARTSDPYAMLSEQLGKGMRQEMFSFAAVSMIDGMGNVERAMLLTSRDTAARLNFALRALDPYLAELRAKASVKKLGLE